MSFEVGYTAKRVEHEPTMSIERDAAFSLCVFIQARFTCPAPQRFVRRRRGPYPTARTNRPRQSTTHLPPHTPTLSLGQRQRDPWSRERMEQARDRTSPPYPHHHHPRVVPHRLRCDERSEPSLSCGESSPQCHVSHSAHHHQTPVGSESSSPDSFTDR